MFNFGKSSKGSTGFGLHYCKIFVEANSGKMSVSSPGRGKGATLSVEFENQNLPK
jgi:K+-sensing histidine kinase KdpD